MYRGCPKYPWILSTPGSGHCVLVGTVGCTEDVLSIPGYLVHRDQDIVCWWVLYRGCPKYPGILSTPGSEHRVGGYCGMYRGCPKYPRILSTQYNILCKIKLYLQGNP